MYLAIDFGASNTDAIARHADGTLQRWTIPSAGNVTEARILAVLQAGKIAAESLRALAVTGGDRSQLGETFQGITIRSVPEVEAIGRGGLAMAKLEQAAIVSAGSGTAVIAAGPAGFGHISGTGVGGGTLLGLARMLIGSADAPVIDALARAGNHTVVNLTIGEIIGEAIGSLPPDTTAVNFGRLARQPLSPNRADLAAGIVNLVGQVIAVVAINAARSRNLERIVVVGHLADLASIRTTILQVGSFYGAPIDIPAGGGYATAMGALMLLEQVADETA
jgi:type II pantothenate kinase